MSTQNIIEDPITIAIRTALTDTLALFHYGDYKGNYVLFDKKPNNGFYSTFVEKAKKRGMSLDMLSEEDRRNFVETFLPANNGLFTKMDGFTVIDSSAVRISGNESTKRGNYGQKDEFRLSKFAYIPGNSYMKLKELAIEEDWGPKDNNGRPISFLKVYLNRMFRRFYKLDADKDVKKHIVYSKNDTRCLFSTGLYTNFGTIKGGEEIFVLLKENWPDKEEPWRFCDFITKSDSRIKDFDPIPEFDRNRDFEDELNKEDLFKCVYGDGMELTDMNLKHAVLEHVERFPISFLEKRMDGYKKFDFDNRKTDVNFWREVKSFLDSNSGRECLSMMARDVHGEMLMQDKIARRTNGDYAVKVFYDKENTIQYYLPLYLGENKPKVGILCKIHHNRYFGHTIYTPYMAYKGARVLGQLQSYWFIPEFIDVDDKYISDVSDDMKNRNNYK